MARRPHERYCYCPERYIDVDMKVLLEFKQELIKELLTNSEGIQLPHGFGVIQIIGVANTVLANPHLSKLYGKEILHDNSHTDNITFGIEADFFMSGYNRIRDSFSHAFLFNFKPYRDVKRKLFEHIMAGNWRHFIVKDENPFIEQAKLNQKKIHDYKKSSKQA